MERVHMKLELLRGETLRALEHSFMEKVQEEEKLKEIEVQIQFKRGMLDALEKAQGVVAEVYKAERIEAEEETLRKQEDEGDGSRDPVKIPLEAKV